MADLIQTINAHSGTSDEDLKKAGKAAGDDMAAAHKRFLADLISRIDRKEINPFDPASLVDQEKRNKLPEIDRGKVDVNATNMASQIQKIEDFFRNKATPNASPELQTMIEYLWENKKRIETQYGPLFRF